MNSLSDVNVSALSIDVEDGINISMYDNFNIKMEPTSRVVNNVDVILNICEKNNVKGTFFILGEVAEKYPEMVKNIDSSGHEIGVHGYKHSQIYKLSPEKLREHLFRSVNILGDITGKEVYGFRAPAFSINKKTAWALNVISDCGFKYDSSIFPSPSFRYGWKDFTKDISRIELGASKSLIEVPLSVIRLLGRDIPVGGGGYLRYFPYIWTKRALMSVIRYRPAVIYLHPYELDTKNYPEYFHNAIKKSPLKKRILLSMYRYNKNTVVSKLDRITKDFNFVPLINIINQMDEVNVIPSIKIRLD